MEKSILRLEKRESRRCKAMLNMNLQLFAHKKGMGSTKNGRDSGQRDLEQREQTVSLYLQVTLSTDSVEQRFFQVLM